ncbi:hypothetical protein HH214_04135 [Mucilaginibacter robiniae]|uniref:Uncharacterized protein n=1 Tax=Mucilaginibacter robiniae TaxID=2728022 RepID=A0A7L5DVL7_9SPHI|nr:hypothetical protein [Mucilaginibacter robiniae]QJD95122.1 hypothetical protein HH214_04135 [Mucilaginibacter robiniae]
MPKDDLPTYPIVEILIRLSDSDHHIGSYKDHTIHDQGVIVKTTQGIIDVPLSLILQQFHQPELITDSELAVIATSFRKI